MATDKRQFTMRMQPENFNKIKVIAEKNKRSMAMQIEYLLEQCIAEYEAEYGKINQPSVVQNNQHGNNVLALGGNTLVNQSVTP